MKSRAQSESDLSAYKSSQNHFIHSRSTDMRGNRNDMTSVQDGISIKQGFKQTFKKKKTTCTERKWNLSVQL